jgi:TPP-dependent pyruvate/acetoin dehydrogenase alpha subunit
LARDPITLFGSLLESGGVLSEAAAAEIRASVVRDIDEASERAVSAPTPTIDDVRRNVYAGQG